MTIEDLVHALLKQNTRTILKVENNAEIVLIKIGELKNDDFHCFVFHSGNF